MEAAAAASTALAARDYPLAITHYTTALATHPQNPTYRIGRSTAYTRTSQPALALADAEAGLRAAAARGKRELMAQAQLRRGVALFMLERWGDARAAFGWCKGLGSKDGSLGVWEEKVRERIAGLEEGDEGGRVAVKEMPEEEEDGAEAVKTAKDETKKEPAKASAVAAAPPPPPPAATTDPSKIRTEWFQSADRVTLSILAKGVPAAAADVQIAADSLHIALALPGGRPYSYTAAPLFAAVDAAASSWKVLGTKVEVVLAKAHKGVKWVAIEGTAGAAATAVSSSSAPAATAPAATGPAYPTSSKSGPKNWDKIVRDMSKKPPKAGAAPTDSSADGATASPDADKAAPDDADSDSGDEVNAFFKKLYKGADADTRRAMVKSYQESNGTALSTNWAEVGKGKVEVSPPDGMEAKPWGS